MAVIKFPGVSHKGLTAREVLQNMIDNPESADLKDIIVIGVKHDRTSLQYATSHDPGFLAVTSLIVTDLAHKSIRGELD